MNETDPSRKKNERPRGEARRKEAVKEHKREKDARAQKKKNPLREKRHQRQRVDLF